MGNALTKKHANIWGKMKFVKNEELQKKEEICICVYAPPPSNVRGWCFGKVRDSRLLSNNQNGGSGLCPHPPILIGPEGPIEPSRPTRSRGGVGADPALRPAM